MTHLQIWLQNHNRRLTQAAIDEALMEYITHIESKLEAARKDAERYRWLRDSQGGKEVRIMFRNEWDTSIDAAIEQAKGGVK